MNPDTGKMHPVMMEMEDEAERQRKALEKLTGKVQARQRALIAEDVPEANLKKGDPIPSNWPQFEIDEMIPIKGFHFKLERVDCDCLVLKFHGMTKAEQRRRQRGKL